MGQYETEAKILAYASSFELGELAHERTVGAIKAFYRNGGDDVGTAAKKTNLLSSAVQRVAHVLGMTWAELRFALIKLLILVDCNPDLMKRECDYNANALYDYEATDGARGNAHKECADAIASAAGKMARKHGWPTVLRTLFSTERALWLDRRLVDQVRLQDDSVEKLRRMKEAQGNSFDGIDRGVGTPLAPSYAAGSYTGVDRDNAKVDSFPAAPRPFTWAEFIRSQAEGPEAVVNTRLDRANVTASAEPTDDTVTIRDLDTGRTTKYTPPVRETRTFFADTDGMVTARRTVAEPIVAETYWCYGCEMYHDRDDND